MRAFGHALLVAAASAVATELSSDPSPATLTFGVPVYNSFTSNSTKYQYYQYTYAGGQDGNGITIYVGQYSGDVDLVVNHGTTLPVIGKADFTSFSTYSENVNIPKTDCPVGPCVYTIGVTFWGTSGADYYVMVTNDAAPTTLTPGESLSFYTAANDDEHFLTTYTPKSSFSNFDVSTTMIWGTAVTCVMINPQPDFWPQWRNLTDYCDAFTWSTGVAVVTPQMVANPLSKRPCADGAACPIAISMFARTEAYYAVTATADSTTTVLEDGVPITGYVASWQTEYFSFEVTAPGDVVISAQDLAGDVDLFASATWKTPNSMNATWFSVGFGNELIRISTTDAGYLPPPATYYIGIASFGFTNATFVLTATVDASGNQNVPIDLTDGLPAAGSAPAHQFAYFTFTYYAWGGMAGLPLDILASPTGGDVDVYVSLKTTTDAQGNVVPVFPQVNCTTPGSQPGSCTAWTVDPNTYDYSSDPFQTPDLIAVPTTNMANGTTVAIGVLATTADGIFGAVPPPSNFTLVAATAGVLIDLDFGVPFSGSVQQGQFGYYRILISQANADVIILATPWVGDVDLFASATLFDIHPDPNSNQWNSTTNHDNGGFDRHLHIPWSELPEACQAVVVLGIPCHLYVSVFGVGSATNLYDITAHLSGSPTSPTYLTDGQGTSTWIPPYSAQYFYALVSVTQGQPIYVIVDNWGFSNTALYVNGDDTKGFYVPGAKNQPSPDYFSPDIGGYERIFIQPSPLPAPQTAPAADKAAETLGAVLRDPSTGKEIKMKARTLAVSAVAGDKTSPDAQAVRTLLELTPEEANEAAPVALEAARIVDGDNVRALSWSNPQDAVYLHKYGHKLNPALPFPAELASYGRVAALKEDTRRYLQAGSLESKGSVGSIPYCTFCSLYITVAAPSSDASWVTVTYASGSTSTELRDGIAAWAYVDPPPAVNPPANGGPYQYFTFPVTDVSADVTFDFTAFVGQVDAYILVQSDKNPYTFPSTYTYTWSAPGWLGINSISIPASDPNACKPFDGLQPNPGDLVPCTYLIAVRTYGADTAYFSVQATSSNAVYLPLLSDGVPESGSVTDGSYSYFTFDASHYNKTTNFWHVFIHVEMLLGGTELYVTNDYITGISGSAMLPKKGNTNICMWSNNVTSNLIIGPPIPFFRMPDPSCWDPTKTVYTIGVLGASGVNGTANGGSPFVNEFVLTATMGEDHDDRLPMNVPLTGQFAMRDFNMNYTLEIQDASKDLLIAVTPTYGEVVVMLSKHHTNDTSATSNPAPYCHKGFAGAQLNCFNYTWLVTGKSGATTLYIPAGNPCKPVAGEGLPAPIVNPQACNNGNAHEAYMPGRYYLTVHTASDHSEYSVLYTQPTAGNPITLADGAPQLMQTAPLSLCTQRKTDGTCKVLGAPKAQGSVFRVDVPPADGQDLPTGYVMIERICEDDARGHCGQPLIAYAHTCRASACSPSDAVPYQLISEANSTIDGTAGALALPLPSTGPCGSVPPVNSQDACVHFISVFPVCNASTGGVTPYPGVGCVSDIFRVTYSSGSDAERIPDYCLLGDEVCDYPAEMITSTDGRRYEVAAGLHRPQASNVSVLACQGDVDLYVCNWQRNPKGGMPVGKCFPPTLPGPHNFDAQYTSANPAEMARWSEAAAGLVWFTVDTAPTTAVANPVYQLQLARADAPRLMVPGATPAAPGFAISQVNDTAVSVTITTAPALSNAAKYPNPLKHLVYAVYAFPNTKAFQAQNYHLQNGCGVTAAFNYFPNSAVPHKITNGSAPVVLGGLTAGQQYLIVVVGNCPSGTCMPVTNFTAPGQYLSYGPLVFPPPPPSNKHEDHGSPAGAIVGAIIGVAVLGVLVWKRKKVVELSKRGVNKCRGRGRRGYEYATTDYDGFAMAYEAGSGAGSYSVPNPVHGVSESSYTAI